MPPKALPHVFVVTALGVDIGLEMNDPDMAGEVRAAWSDAASSSTNAADTTLSVGYSPDCDVTGRDVAEILHVLSPAVTLRAMQARAGELVMLHAAALAVPETGAAVVLVAPSGTGKTTAARTLGRHLAYLSDETSGIEPDGAMVAHVKPLSVIRTGHLKDQVSPSQLGLLTTDRSCHLAAILVLERNPAHQGTPTVTLLETIDALAVLAPQASSLGRLDRPLHRLVELIDRVGGVRHIIYAEAATLEPVVHDLLDREPA